MLKIFSVKLSHLPAGRQATKIRFRYAAENLRIATKIHLFIRWIFVDAINP